MLRGSEESQDRVLAILGAALVLGVALAVLAVVVNPFGGRTPDLISVTIETPYVGQGVEVGTAVVMHGVQVGKVASVASLPGGGVRLGTDLEKRPTAGLTDAVSIDFRPINYFGVPGINLNPNLGGQALRDGSDIKLVPKGNFTLTELLSQLGDVTAGAITPQLIKVIDRTTRYTDGLNPLLETMVIATTAVADVQTVPTPQLLGNAATVSAAIPGFADAAVDAGTRVISYNYPQGESAQASATGARLAYPFLVGVKTPDLQDETEDYFQNVYLKFTSIASEGLFAAVGRLESSHVDDLLPLIDGIKSLSDTVPPLLRPEDIARTLAELRSRLENLYAGNGEQRAIQVRILLDSLPGVAAPLGVMGVTLDEPVPPQVQPGGAGAPPAQSEIEGTAAAAGGPLAPPNVERSPG